MAKGSGLSHTTIWRIWGAFGLQPHRAKTFKLSSDPYFVDKVRDIVGLYVLSPAHALARRSHWHVHFTPTSASWLNQAERWFAELTRKQLQRSVHR